MKWSSLIRAFLVVLVVMVLLTSMTAIQADTEKEGVQYGQSTTDDLNFRSSPDSSADSNVIGKIAAGEKFEILATEGSWYRIMYNDKVGYVHNNYVYVISQSGTRGAYVISDGTMLMGGPTVNSYAVTELTAGLGVKVKGIVDGWYFCVAGTDSGYVQLNRLKLISSDSAETPQLRYGMKGEEIEVLQTTLIRKGFLDNKNKTSVFDEATLKAVKEFQKVAGIAQDGIVGGVTQRMLQNGSIRKENALYNQLKGSVKLLDWFKGGNEWFKKYTVATVTDVRTGLSFRIRRFGGWYHADCEPLTAYDTQIMFRVAGGKWSWNRRPIWVTLNGKTVAASMHCMPHMVNPTPSNNFDGHFCIHLLNSKVHATSAACPRHQACVREAYNKGK
ncbi:MAG: SH3 domain-containing protein [Clostridiales bacterium]|nr:SH3 domain-containing protein [Clostridiales bacterium]